MAARRPGNGGIGNPRKPANSSACRRKSAGTFLLSQWGVRAAPGGMAGGIGGEERYDNRAWVELRRYAAFRAASAGGWRAGIRHRIRGRDDRVYGGRAFVATRAAQWAGLAIQGAQSLKRTCRGHIYRRQRRALNARIRLFLGVRIELAAHIHLPVQRSAGLVCLLSWKLPYIDLGWAFLGSQLCICHRSSYVPFVGCIPDRQKATADYPARNVDAAVLLVDYVYLVVRAGAERGCLGQMGYRPKDPVHVPRRLRPDHDAGTARPTDLGRRANDRDLGGEGRPHEHPAWRQSNSWSRRRDARGQQRFRPRSDPHLAIAVLSVAPRHEPASSPRADVDGIPRHPVPIHAVRSSEYARWERCSGSDRAPSSRRGSSSPGLPFPFTLSRLNNGLRGWVRLK